MLEPPLGPGTRHWQTPNGELWLWQPAPHVIVTRFQGSMYDPHLAELTMTAIESIFATQARVDIFHDWEEMELYATKARTIMTERSVPHAAKRNSLNVLFNSKVVLMGLSMAALKLGGINSYTDRKTFERALREAAGDRANPPLLIMADARTPYQAVVSVMDAARQLGFVHLSIATRDGEHSR